jgi:NAD(P)H-flavin reductase
VEESPELVEGDALPAFSSRVLGVEELRPEIYRVFIERPKAFEFQSGQFVHLTRPADGLTRSYSIASLEADRVLELHVARLPGGEMSHFLTSNLGAALELRGPLGDCVYFGNSDEPLLLVGTGTGLAPLLGVVRTALERNHQAPIHLVHGAPHEDRLYLRKELRELDSRYEQFSYSEDVLHPEPASPGSGSRASSVGLPTLLEERFADLEGTRVYLCGDPQLMHRLKRQCFLAGAAMRSIHSDPFVLSRQPVA